MQVKSITDPFSGIYGKTIRFDKNFIKLLLNTFVRFSSNVLSLGYSQTKGRRFLVFSAYRLIPQNNLLRRLRKNQNSPDVLWWDRLDSRKLNPAAIATPAQTQ